ncbi:putative enoyl-CoA hydratase [Rhizocola hellebori]|uniref:Putative enoyl-CoA hydratase n=1 Tax=Rhizocola hellebori TaxID=1392758 RepID=A0A8J3VGT5_9ACTN|nr:enoyl-CoA hydratase/isomerase family protein [Rhizocola hellebori]GIH06699.1 putative enoyl-CoA hydratase [Rhizocola hellebori]
MINLSTPREHVALITLQRPERRNALDLNGFRALADAWRSIAANTPEIRVAVVTGGSDFSSGADLGSFASDVAAALRGGEPPQQLWGDVHHALLRDIIMPVPVVAAIEGHCLGAGMELVGATDIRIAAASAGFALPEVRHGFMASGGSVARLPRQIGYAAAMQVLLTGARFGAERMREWGFVSEVVADGSALQRALEVAEQIAQNSPVAVAAVKHAVGEGLRGSLAEAFEIETRISDGLFVK